MNAPASYRWAHIQDLPTDWTNLRDTQIEALIAAWHDQLNQLKSRQVYDEFIQRLRRQWAIETGVIERLYNLSDGATKTLIEKGLDASLITHSDTDKNPALVVALIRDQHSAIEGLYQFISGERPLGTSYIKELHRTLTENQGTYEARDTLGHEVLRQLPKGQWKVLPNNVAGPDGFVFEFCPPEHVDSEMENLLKMHSEHARWNVPPYIEAAWLHHRFALIHPFTDGNGRVARCLATLVFLKEHWFPPVVTRADRNEYIEALRQADRGDIRRLVKFFITLQGRAVREAFSLSEQVTFEKVAIGNLLGSVKDQFTRAKQATEVRKKQVLQLADALQQVTHDALSDLAPKVDDAVKPGDTSFKAYASASKKGAANEGYHYHQIVLCAKALGYFANLEAYQSWANLTIVTKTKAELLFAFHGMGRFKTGVIVCSAMFYTKPARSEIDSLPADVKPLSDEPFTFTFQEDPAEVKRRFRHWLDDRILLGLQIWKDATGT